MSGANSRNNTTGNEMNSVEKIPRSGTFGHSRKGAVERVGSRPGQASDSFLAKIPRVPEDSYVRGNSAIANRRRFG